MANRRSKPYLLLRHALRGASATTPPHLSPCEIVSSGTTHRHSSPCEIASWSRCVNAIRTYTSTQEEKSNVVVIRGGPSGHVAAIKAAQLGQKTLNGGYIPSKIEKKFFSAAAKPVQRQTGGKVTDCPDKVASLQKQSNGKSVPPTAAKVFHKQYESNTSPEKSSSSYFLMVGACSFLVIGLLTLYQWDLLKNMYIEEKKEEEPQALSEDTDQVKSKDVSLTISEAKEERGSLNEVNHPHVAKRQESSNECFDMQKKDAQDGAAGHALNTENLSASAAPTKTESKSIENISSADDNHVGEKNSGVTSNDHKISEAKLTDEAQNTENLSASAKTESQSSENISSADDSHVGEKISGVTSNDHKISEAQLKDEVSQSIGHVPAGNLLPANSSHDLNNNQLSVTSRKEDNLFSSSNTSFPTTNKESEGLSEDLNNNKEPNLLQAPLKGTMRRPSLFEAYYLANRDENSTSIQEEELVTQNKDDLNSQRHEGGEKSLGIKGGVLVDGTHTDTVHNAFDLLEVVHAAEKRQAELDAQFYAEAQKRLTQAFQQELKDAQAKELMYAEEANRLAKEIEFEKQRAVAVLELEQEKARESLHQEIKHKEEETDLKLKKAELLSKTQIAAAVAEEKLSYLKDVKDVKQELEALYMAFFTQSEEVRQSHTVHKLAVGTFALEDAMKRGLPVQKEVALICSSYGGAGSDPLLDAIISSIPEQVTKKGTMTPSQLQQKFETMKGEVLELSLLPATGGGLLSHAAAKMVSKLKVKEIGQYSDGLDAIVSQVQRFLTDGKLADAADLLEKGVGGTEAQVLAADWIKCARDRAVMEQILLLLQAHATTVASSLA